MASLLSLERHEDVAVVTLQRPEKRNALSIDLRVEIAEAFGGLGEEAEVGAIVLTVDLPVLGQRERDLRNGATIPPKITVRNVVDVLRRPGWLRRVWFGPDITFQNFVGSSTALTSSLISPTWVGPLTPSGGKAQAGSGLVKLQAPPASSYRRL